MLFGKLGVLNAFSVYSCFPLMIDLLGGVTPLQVEEDLQRAKRANIYLPFLGPATIKSEASEEKGQ